MKKLLIGILTFTSLNLIASEKVCIVKRDAFMTLAAGYKYQLACNDGKSYSTKPVISGIVYPYLFKQANFNSLESFFKTQSMTMNKQGEISVHDSADLIGNDKKPVYIYSSSSSESKWIYVRRDSGVTVGPKKEKRYNFAQIEDYANSYTSFQGYTEAEFYEHFSSMGYKEVILSKDQSFYSGTISILHNTGISNLNHSSEAKGTVHLFKL